MAIQFLSGETIDGSATFTGDVTIGSTGAGSDKILNILTGGSDSTIKLMEAGTIYGFSQVYSGANNQFYIKRHSNSATGSAVITLNRDNDNATFAGDVTVGGTIDLDDDITLANGKALRWTSDDVRIEGTTAGDNITFYVAANEIFKLEQTDYAATFGGGITTGALSGGNSGGLTIAGGITQTFQGSGGQTTFNSYTNSTTASGATDASSFLISQKDTGGSAIEYKQGVIADGNAFFGKWHAGSITGIGLEVSTGNVTFSGDVTVDGTMTFDNVINAVRASFVSTAAGLTVVSAEGAYASSGSVKLYEAKRTGGAVGGDWSYDDATTDMSLGTNTNHAFNLKTNNTNRIEIDNAGNVGMGISPTEKLDIFKDSGSTYIRVYDSSANSEVGLKLQGDTKTWTLQNWGSGGDNLRILNNAGTTVQLWDDNGNVMIGNGNDPAANLQVESASATTIAISNSSSVTSGNRGDLAWYNSAVSTVAIIRAGADTDNVGTNLQFHTRPVGGAVTETIRITSAGTIYNPNTQGSTWFGDDAGLSQVGTAGSYNTLYGFHAGRLITTGQRNTIIGGLAGDASGTNTMNYNVVIGSYAGSALANTSNSNVLVGDGAGSSSTGMSGNVIIGQGAGDGNTGASNVFIGYNAAPVNTSGQRNVAIGNEALRYNITGIDVVAIGYRALYNDASIEESTAVGSYALYTQTSGRNTAIGFHSLQDLTTGTYNTAVGGESAENITDGNYNVAVGTFSLRALTEGDENTAVGYQALANNTTQNKLTALGYRSGYFWTAGDENTFIGYHAGYGSAAGSTGHENTLIGSYTGASSAGISGDGNTSLGRFTLYSLTSGSFNTALGHQAGAGISTGDANTVVGKNAGNVIAGGSRNSILGQSAGIKITSGADNVAIGYEALYNVATTSLNVAIGVNSLYTYTGSRSVAIGYGAGKSLTSDVDNVFIGQETGFGRTAGVDNTFVGAYANYGGGTGCCNTGFGKSTGYSLSSGVQNTMIGRQAGYTIDVADNNTLVGHNSGINVTGSGNSTLGAQAGNTMTGGVQNVLLGFNVDTGAAGDDYCIVISSDQDLGKGSSTAFIAPNGGGVYQDNNTTTWATTSDERIKKNIVDNNKGLEIIDKIQVRNFEYRTEDEITDFENPQSAVVDKEGVQLGVIAQELEKILPKAVKEESTGIKSVDANDLTWYLINAVKELKAEIELLKSK